MYLYMAFLINKEMSNKHKLRSNVHGITHLHSDSS